MNIHTRVRQVEKIFSSLQQEIDDLKASTGLNCVAGCGACCTKPDVETTVLEFLPLALHFYKTGQTTALLEKLDQQPEDTICPFFTPVTIDDKAGFCSQYKYRGLICRMFGFSGYRDKNGQINLSTCRKIKENLAGLYQQAAQDISEGKKIPVYSDYYQRLANIDFNLGSKLLPINKAIVMAIELVELHFYYKSFRAS
ncbi:MAG: YkgJ family cysteine cluster protein [Candidatus Cyclobacteriaceae bacterium M3_2C_046]